MDPRVIHIARTGNRQILTSNTQLLVSSFIRLSTSAVEGGQTTSSGRPQSPVTQAVESSFRKMAQGVTSSIDAASASLKESLGEVHQHLLRDFGDTERQMVEQLEVLL